MDNGQQIFPTGINSQSFQSSPIVSGSSDSVSSVSKNGKRKWLILLAAIVFLGAMITIIIWAFMSKSGSGEVTSTSVNQEVYTLMNDSYEDITNIQQTFIDLRDGYYSAVGLFTEANHAYINEMAEKIQDFYQRISQIDSSKITISLAQENFEKLKTNLSQNIAAYTDTVDLYNSYYESGENGSETIVADIFAAYTNTEEFTSVYYYQIIGDIIAELQSNEEE